LMLRQGGSPSRATGKSITVAEDEDAIRIDTGSMQCVFSKKGSMLIQSILQGAKTTATDGQLVLQWQNLPEPVPGESLLSDALQSEIREAVVEHAGPVRVVIKT